LIDWLTLRTPVSHFLTDHLFEQFHKFVGVQTLTDSDGEVIRSRPVFDVDKIRSDAKGIFWQISSDGKNKFVTVGASPASLEFDSNVFGSSDIRHCAEVLLHRAQVALSIILPPPSAWECRRIDVTHNYLLDDHSQVKQALRELRKGDGVRQKASVPKGDTVYWGQGSDLIGAKAYDKGSQVEYQQKRKPKDAKPMDEATISMLKRLLRLELSLKRRWFDRHGQDWLSLTEDDLNQLHHRYFSQFIGTIEVTDMTTLLRQLEEVTPTKGRALAAHRTWALVKAIGFEQTKSSMPESTFYLHQKYLREAGLSNADLHNSNLLPFRRNVIAISDPVRSWSELFKVAA
jgi:II/X family phage/plasmid replication protein